MRHQNNFKTIFVNLKKQLVIIAIILFSQFINAQVPGTVGPTLIISSALTGDYTISKNNGFDITNEYVMVHVNSAAADTGIASAPNFKYLDQAINYYLGQNYQRIIILEGDYTVNGSIVVDFVNGLYTTPINTPILPSTTEVGNVGRITIEGEGFGTRITNQSSGSVFEVKSNYNIIKNMSILTNDGSVQNCISLSNGSTSSSNNLFENLYLGNKLVAGDSDLTSVVQKGLLIGGTGKNNIFRNLVFNRFKTAVEIAGGSNNHFEDFAFDNIEVAVHFTGASNDNVFENFSLQTDNTGSGVLITLNLIKDVKGINNIFKSMNPSDWTQQTGRSLITLTATATHTTIENSKFSQSPLYFTENGAKYTQIINCYGGNSDVNNKIGVTAATAGEPFSTTEILGKLKLDAADPDSGLSTIGQNRYLAFDNISGNAKWVPVSPVPVAAWDYTAIKNIKMNGWAITGNDNSNTNLSANGLRLDNNGNVRIGTAAPINNDGKLQVDGNFVSKQLNTDGSVGDAQLTVKDGKVIIGKFSDDLLTNPNSAGYNLLVNGKARVKEEVYVKGNEGTLTWPDYVFAKEYKLMPLQQVEQHIQEKGFLPNMPSAAEVEKEGIAMADMITRQQEKIEELTLYIIAMKKELEQIKANQK